jgi:hypothetical protein
MVSKSKACIYEDSVILLPYCNTTPLFGPDDTRMTVRSPPLRLERTQSVLSNSIYLMLCATCMGRQTEWMLDGRNTMEREPRDVSDDVWFLNLYCTLTVGKITWHRATETKPRFTHL